MLKKLVLSLAFCLVASLPCQADSGPQEPVMLRAHSHNDYEQLRPLAEALDNKFGSVEADIFLVNGELLVAHTPSACKPERTLESMYLAPLAARAKDNAGHIYPGGADIVLLIDIKTEANTTYAVLRKQLEKYAALLTHFRGDEVKPGAVTVVLSGNRPIDVVKAEPERLYGIDGRLKDLQGDSPAALYPWISDSWRPTFKWSGEGAMPAEELATLRDFVAKAHAGGHKLRFWGLPPNSDTVWPVLFEAGVDYLNSDDLPKLRGFLLSHAK